MKKYLKKYLVETICLSIIICFSLLNMYKAKLLSTSYSNYLQKQMLWILIGLVLYIIIYKIKFKHIYKSRYIIYGINILMLIYVLIFSKSTNGIKAWIKIKSFSIQPSELVKITLPICLIKLVKDKKYLLSFIIYIVPTILILLEPDTGNAVLIFFIYIYILIGKTNKKYLLSLFIFVSTLFISSLIIFKCYPKLIINIFNGSLYYRFKRLFSISKNYQINNALIGIGSAKLLPIPINKLLIYIPEGITDFIFAFNICNYGIILTAIFLLTYIIFVNKLLIKFGKKQYYFKKKLTGSFIVLILIQTSYNIFMNIGLLPIMGIPLPFVSYGGSNIITYFVFYALATKKISSIEDKDNNNYKNNYHMALVEHHN